MTPEALTNLRSLLQTSPLAAISMLHGSAEARALISLEEIAPLLQDKQGPAYHETLALIKAYYAGGVEFYTQMPGAIKKALGVTELPPDIALAYKIISNDINLGPIARLRHLSLAKAPKPVPPAVRKPSTTR